MATNKTKPSTKESVHLFYIYKQVIVCYDKNIDSRAKILFKSQLLTSFALLLG